jgi:hypothetical protein
MKESGSPESPVEIRQARAIGKRHHLFIIEVDEKGRPAWVLYREGNAALHTRTERIARRSDPAEMLRLVLRIVTPSTV